MASFDPIKPINGKRLVVYAILGAFFFTVFMGFGTYLLANVMEPYLRSHAKKPAGTIAKRLESTDVR